MNKDTCKEEIDRDIINTLIDEFVHSSPFYNYDNLSESDKQMIRDFELAEYKQMIENDPFKCYDT